MKHTTPDGQMGEGFVKVILFFKGVVKNFLILMLQVFERLALLLVCLPFLGTGFAGSSGRWLFNPKNPLSRFSLHQPFAKCLEPTVVPVDTGTVPVSGYCSITVSCLADTGNGIGDFRLCRMVDSELAEKSLNALPSFITAVIESVGGC